MVSEKENQTKMEKKIKTIRKWYIKMRIVFIILLSSVIIPVISFFLVKKEFLALLIYSILLLLYAGILVFLFRQVSRLPQMIKEMRLQKDHSRRILNSLGEGLITTNINGKVTYMNPEAERLTGWNWQDAKGQPLQNIYNVVSEETEMLFENIVSRILKGGKRIDWENNTILKAKTSDLFIISNSGSPILDSKGNIAGAVVVFKDISIRKKAEKELRIANQRLVYHLNNSPLAIIEWDRDFIIKSWSVQAENIFGWKEAETINKHFNDFNLVFQEDAPVVASIANELVTGIKESNKSINRNNTKSGKIIYCQWFNSVLKDEKGNIESIQSLILDITEQKKAEEKLIQLSQAVEQSPASIVITDTKGDIEYVNKKFVELTGYTNSEVIGKNPRILKSGFTPAFEYENLWKQISSGVEWRGELHNKKKNGELYWEAALISPVLNSKDEITHFLAIKEDITQRKKAETLMKQAFDRYDILAQATSDTIWDWDIINKKMLYNNGISKMFGYQDAEIENVVDWWKEKLHPEDLEKVAESLQEVFEKRLPKVQLTYRYRCADGSYKNIFDRAFVLFDENGKPSRMIGAMQDITYHVQEEIRISKAIIDAHEEERRHIGEELHDNVNQILAGSLLTLGMAKETKNDTDKASDLIEMAKGYISYAIDEIRKLSHQLVVVRSDDNSLKDLFENLLLSINLNNRFTVNLHFDEFDEKVVSDDVQINLYRILQEQVKNIMKYSEASSIEVAVTLPGNAVNMRISDDGKGFDTKVKKRR